MCFKLYFSWIVLLTKYCMNYLHMQLHLILTSHSIRQVLLLCPFADEETEAQRNLPSHKAHDLKSQDLNPDNVASQPVLLTILLYCQFMKVTTPLPGD